MLDHTTASNPFIACRLLESGKPLVPRYAVRSDGKQIWLFPISGPLKPLRLEVMALNPAVRGFFAKQAGAIEAAGFVHQVDVWVAEKLRQFTKGSLMRWLEIQPRKRSGEPLHPSWSLIVAVGEESSFREPHIIWQAASQDVRRYVTSSPR